MLTVVLCYFFNSQVTPYFHFHHHDHESHDKLTLSAETSNDECTHLLSCEVHSHDHEMLEIDWNVVRRTQYIQINTSFDLRSSLPDISIDNPAEGEVLVIPKNCYELRLILPNYSNKAPPFYA